MPRFIPTFKKFDGKRYKYWNSFVSKIEAMREVSLMHWNGYNARYSKFANVYVVYIRPKKGEKYLGFKF